MVSCVWPRMPHAPSATMLLTPHPVPFPAPNCFPESEFLRMKPNSYWWTFIPPIRNCAGGKRQKQ